MGIGSRDMVWRDHDGGREPRGTTRLKKWASKPLLKQLYDKRYQLRTS